MKNIHLLPRPRCFNYNYISASTSSYGIRVRSGIDTTTIYYPSGPSTLDESYGDTYDNTKDISLTTIGKYTVHDLRYVTLHSIIRQEVRWFLQ